MGSEAQRAASRRYYEKTKKTHKVYLLRFDRKADADVIAAIDAAPSKVGYIRELVRGKSDA